MATLSSTDIIFYYTNQGSYSASGNTYSIGGSLSVGNTIPDNTINNIYDDVTGDESSGGTIEYRAIAIKDTHASASMLDAKVWINGYVRAASNNDVVSFALEGPKATDGASLHTLLASAYVAPNANNFTVATGLTVSWTEEGEPSSTLSFGTLTYGQWFGVWLRRSVPASAAAYSNRAVTLKVQCETTGSPRMTVQKIYIVNFGNKGGAIPVVGPY